MVRVKLTETSQPLVYEKVINTYTKGGLYCILYQKGNEKLVHKYPLCNVFRIEETV